MSLDNPGTLEENDPTENENILQNELLDSLMKGDIEKFEILLPKVNPKFKYSSEKNATCLEIACMTPNRGKFVQVLLNFVDPTLANVNSQPIHLAAELGHSDSLDVLVSDRRTDIVALDHKGNTALILICLFITGEKKEQYKQCFERLVSEMSPSDLNIKNKDGLTAFHALVRGTRMMQRVWNSKMSMDSCNSQEEVVKPSQENREARMMLAKLMVTFFQNDLDIETSVQDRSASEDLEENFPDLKDHLIELTKEDKVNMDLINCLKSKRIDRLRDLVNQSSDGVCIYNVNQRFGWPLHTTCLHYACEFGLGAKCIQVLLEAKADPNDAIRPTMKSPIHVLCEKGHHEELLAMFTSAQPPEVNATDKFKNTALHYLLDKPVSSKIQRGRRKCLRILLEQNDLNVNALNISCVSPIMIAIQNKLEKLLKDVLVLKSKKINWELEQDGISIRTMIRETFPNFENYIPPTQVGNSEVDSGTRKISEEEEIDNLFSLLRMRKEKKFVEEIKKRRILSVSNSTKSHSLLQKAAYYGLTESVTALLDQGANPNFVIEENRSPPAVIASKHRRYDVLRIFLENRKNNFNVNAQDSLGNTALHYATRTEYAAKNLDIVISLLKCGGSLELTNHLGKPPINQKQLQSLLDQCLDTNKKNAFEDEYEIIFKYQLIASSNSSYRDELEKEESNQINSHIIPIGKESKSTLLLNSNILLKTEMDFLFKMSKSEELSYLLDHPVCLTFLTQKWNRAKFLVYLNIFFYITFLLLLNTFIVHCAYPMSHNLRKKMKNDHDYLLKKSRVKNHMISMAVAIIAFWFIILLREFVQFSINMRKYLLSWDNYLEISLLISSLVTVMIPFIHPDYNLQRTLNVITILLSWTELLVLLGQTSLFAKHIEMLKVVSKNYVLPLLCYCSFVVAFGLSFHTLYRGNPKYSLESLKDEIQNKTAQEIDEENDFNYWHRSIIKALVMMTGELGFESFPKEEYFSMVLFLVFVLLETIVIINLLAGLASQGTDQIENAAVRLERITRVRVLTRVERLLVKLHNASVCGVRAPRCVRRRLRRVVLFAGVAKNERRGWVKPNQSSDLVLCGGSTLALDKATLDRATQVINQRYQSASQEHVCTCGRIGRKGSMRQSVKFR